MLYNKDWERKPNPVSEVLLKAADLLEKHGHIKHMRRSRDGSMCLLGALEEAQGVSRHTSLFTLDTPLTYKASELIVTALGLPHTHSPRGERDDRYAAARWNNDPKRTAREVINAMRKAAEVAARETADAV